jgi:hypothetical protein
LPNCEEFIISLLLFSKFKPFITFVKITQLMSHLRIGILAFSLMMCIISKVMGQSTFLTPADSLHNGRAIAASTGLGIAYVGSMLGLNQLWYANNPKSSFQFFNDNAHWLQMDKLGHAYTAYWIQHRTYALFRWSGMKKGTSMWLSGAYSFLFQGTFEVMDGFAKAYGFSYGDVLANSSGILLFSLQEGLLGKQVFTPKFSFWPSTYAQYRPELLGSTFPEQLLKDYNGQTYWWSLNLSDVTPKSWKIPNWICLSFGYSISEKLKSDQEYYVIQHEGMSKNFTAYRRYLLSLDVDLSRIPVKKAWLKTLLSTVNTLKMPFPSIEFSSRGTKGHWLYY